jgi:hypothetical protein
MVNFTFYYPHPDSPLESLVTTDPYPGMFIGQLWDLALEKRRRLADHIGSVDCTLFIARSFFLYTTGGFSYIHLSRPTCLSFHTIFCSLAAEIGFGSTVMMAKWPPSFFSSPMSSLLYRLLNWCMSLSSPKKVRPSSSTSSLPALCALVLEGLDDLGDLNSAALKRTPVLCVSTAVLLLIVACQNAQQTSNHSGVRSLRHHTASIHSQA